MVCSRWTVVVVYCVWWFDVVVMDVTSSDKYLIFFFLRLSSLFLFSFFSFLFSFLFPLSQPWPVQHE